MNSAGIKEESEIQVTEERRKYVRVSADCMITFRKIVDSEDINEPSRERFDPISSTEISDIACKVHAVGDQRDEMMLELLLWIDWKVNYLIKSLLKDKEALTFPHEADMVDLSAAGMKFSSDEQVALEQQLEFRFFLPVLPFNELILKGVVSRSRQKTYKDHLPPLFEMSVEFQNLKPPDQEILFRYVVKRERQILQGQREQDNENMVL